MHMAEFGVIITFTGDAYDAKERVKSILPFEGQKYDLTSHSDERKHADKLIYEGPKLSENVLRQFRCTNPGFGGYTGYPEERPREYSRFRFIE